MRHETEEMLEGKCLSIKRGKRHRGIEQQKKKRRARKTGEVSQSQSQNLGRDKNTFRIWFISFEKGARGCIRKSLIFAIARL
jgi:hypothetical protein